MRVYKKENSPNFYADFKDGNGVRRRVSTGTTSKKQAKKVISTIEDKEKEKINNSQILSLFDCLSLYKEYLKAHKSDSAVASCTFATQRLTGVYENSRPSRKFHFDKDKKITTFTTQDLDTLASARANEGSSPASTRQEISVFRSAVKHAQALGKEVPKKLLEGKPSTSWRIPSVPVKTRFLSWDEFMLVYEHLDPARPMTSVSACGKIYTREVKPTDRIYKSRVDAQDLALALVLTGGRWSEIKNLTWSNVSLDLKTIRIWSYKTNSERVVPIAPQVEKMLRRRFKTKNEDDMYIFSGKNGSARTSGSLTIVSRAMDAVGLNSNENIERYGTATVHSLRHTYASWLAESTDVDVLAIQRSLGHASVTTTARYSHLLEGPTLRKIGVALDEKSKNLKQNETE